MTTRADIGDYAGPNANNSARLVYTRKCGWIDLGHANPKGQGYIGASSLWGQIQTKTMVDPSRSHIKQETEVRYSQMMSKFGVSDGVSQGYFVQQYLRSEDEQKSIALAIFLDVSIDFEGLQSNWFYRLVTDSGFSAEDLVSNLIGFYRAIYPTIDYIGMCEPVSKEKALAIWDKYGPVGKHKNYYPNPILFPEGVFSNHGPTTAALPPFLNVIKPAVMGQKFKRI